jgi:hypothetical protein
MINFRRLLRSLGIALNLRDPPNLPPYGWSYFDHIVAVYLTLNTADKRADVVIEKSRQRPDDLTWGDVFMLENIIFSLQPVEIVERNAWIIRERFREVACSSIYDQYIASDFPKETDTPEKLVLLRADLCRVLDVLHWHYALIPMREKIRKALTINCMNMVIVYTVVLGGALYLFRLHGMIFQATLSCVIYWGIIGGFVSSQRRMQSIPSDGDPLVSVFGLENAGYYLWLSPLLGAVFAVIITLMFMGGFLTGSVLPEFVRPDGQATGLFADIAQTLPKNGENYAKLFVWAFLAGFAERLVPDSLDRLSSKLTSADRSPKPISPLVGSTSPTPKPPTVPVESQTKIAPETLDNAMHTGEPPADPSKETPLINPDEVASGIRIPNAPIVMSSLKKGSQLGCSTVISETAFRRESLRRAFRPRSRSH